MPAEEGHSTPGDVFKMRGRRRRRKETNFRAKQLLCPEKADRPPGCRGLSKVSRGPQGDPHAKCWDLGSEGWDGLSEGPGQKPAQLSPSSKGTGKFGVPVSSTPLQDLQLN